MMAGKTVVTTNLNPEFANLKVALASTSSVIANPRRVMTSKTLVIANLQPKFTNIRLMLTNIKPVQVSFYAKMAGKTWFFCQNDRLSFSAAHFVKPLRETAVLFKRRRLRRHLTAQQTVATMMSANAPLAAISGYVGGVDTVDRMDF